MDTLQSLIPLALAVSLGGLILAVGLDASLDELTSVLRSPALLLRAVLAVNVIVPAAAIGVLALIPGIAPVAKAGLLLMAASPVPPLVPGQQAKAGGRKAYSRGLYAAMVVLTLITVPVTVALLSRLYGVRAAAPMGQVATQILAGVIAPLIVGLVIRRLAPKAAEAAAPWIGRIAMVLLVLAAVPVLVAVWPAVSGLAGDGTFVAMVAVVLIALAGGHLLGGPDPQDRAALAVTAAIRHPGIAMAIAGANDADKRIQAAILGFVLVQCLLTALYRVVVKRTAARPAAA